MKILYAIQGTGNGHLSRARDIIPILKKKGVDLDILVSGTQADIDIPYTINYQLKGLSFIFGKKGGVNIGKTYLKANSLRLQKEINSLPIEKYNLIINDFEPVSAWACKLKNLPCISLSHQAAVLTPNAPQPKKKDHVGKFILERYAPTTKQYGFHFQKYQDNVFTPVIREEIRNITCKKQDYYTVYLPAYGDEKILNVLSKFKTVNWQVFSKHNKKPVHHNNITIQPISNQTFVNSMANCKGVFCGAGFETPAEALYMNKKLLVVPMKGQYEQQCNAAALKDMNVPVIKSLKKKHHNTILKWIETDQLIDIDYPNITESIIDQLIDENYPNH